MFHADSMALLGGAVAQVELPSVRVISLGPGRFVNRAFLTDTVLDPSALDAVRNFFDQRGMTAAIQTPGDIDADSVALLASHGLAPDWTRSLLAASADDLDADRRPPSDTVISEVGDDEIETWLGVLADGNEAPESLRLVSDEHGRAAHACAGTTDLIARVDGVPAACGSLHLVDGIAWLGGAATLPEHRGRGHQLVLLGCRISIALQAGADIVAATSRPDSVSERNLVRAGLVRIDTQTVWTADARGRPPPSIA